MQKVEKKSYAIEIIKEGKKIMTLGTKVSYFSILKKRRINVRDKVAQML